MQRDDQGRIFYDKSRCIGCRYCQVACPFNVPRFQWDRAVPQIVKCDLCKFTDAATRGSPACAGTCPTGAVAYGRRGDLLREAWARIEGSPDTYRRQVYGENEVGGTNVLYLASVPFDRLGFPNLPDRAPAAFSEKIQHTIYKGFLTPIALYAALFGVAVGHRRRRERKGGD
jgi:ferredoxin